jgi:hypothetical protein
MKMRGELEGKTKYCKTVQQVRQHGRPRGGGKTNLERGYLEHTEK